MIPSLSGVGYVFLTSSRDTDRESRNAEPGLRCFIARLRMDPIDTIIGIGTEQETEKRARRVVGRASPPYPDDR